MKPTDIEKAWISRLMASRLPRIAEESPSQKEADEEKPVPMQENRNKTGGLSEVAGMSQVKNLVIQAFSNVLRNRECAEAYHITPPNLLLWGPPGTGKTHLVTHICKDLGINYLSVSPSELGSTFVHGTQQKIKELFDKAQKMAPCVVFIDELDCVLPQRTTDDRNYQNGEVDEFLVRLSNSGSRGVFVIGATNLITHIDKAVLRPGRFDEIVYVDMPDAKSREDLFRLTLGSVPTDGHIDYSKLAGLSQGFSFADLSYCIKVACRQMFNESIADKGKPYKPVTQSLLEDVIGSRKPSVSRKDLREYERVRNELTNCELQQIGFH